MRSLSIKRAKSFVACLAKAQVYIEDPVAGEVMINNVLCRKLGDLKNGEEKTFPISENETTVFVIADKLSKSYCNEFYKIPAGYSNVYLSGKHHFNPASGNAFRFDGVTDEAVLRNRKRGTRIGIVVLVVAFIVGILLGLLKNFDQLFGSDPEPKTFSAEGMQITLTDDFTELSEDIYTVCYESRDVAVFMLKESFAQYEGLEEYTLEEYGNLVLQANGLETSTALKEYSGLLCFEYDASNPETGETYYYFATVFKAPDAFWTIQFATFEEKAEAYHQTFIDWASTVEFSTP